MGTDRNIRVNLYLTQDEQNQLADNFKIELPVSGQKKLKQFASCIRNAALNKKISFKTTDPIALEQYSQLARLSSNLNQMMHSDNLGQVVGIDHAMQLVNAIRKNLLNIKQENESKNK